MRKFSDHFVDKMLCGIYNYFMWNIKCYYCGASNTNCWIISVSEEMEEVIERQISCIGGSVFIFYRRSSVNYMQGRSEKKV